jgi:hypothetical protein
MAPSIANNSEKNTMGTSSEMPGEKRVLNEEMQRRAEIHEYTSMANPTMALIPVVAHMPDLHESGPSRIETFNLSKHLQVRRVSWRAPERFHHNLDRQG